MPVQQAVDVAVPITVAYGSGPVRGLARVHASDRERRTGRRRDRLFQAKIWGITKRFEADIVEQRPEERIEWNVTEGYAHTGVVTFHELSRI